MANEDEIIKMKTEEESRCIKRLSDFVQEKIVPIDPVYVVGKLQTIDNAIIWYINKLENEIANLRL